MQTLFILILTAILPYTDTTFRPNPLQKPVSICANVRQSDGRPTTRLDVFAQLSKASGIPIHIDRQAIQDTGINIDKEMCLMFCEFPIIGIVEFIMKEIDPDGELAVFYGNDGLTITAASIDSALIRNNNENVF